MASSNITVKKIINKVLVRLREAEITDVGDTEYAGTLLGFLNDAKREVEDAFNWDALRETITLSTSASTSLYSVTAGSQYTNERTRLLKVYDTTSDNFLLKTNYDTINRWQKYDTNEAAPGFWAPAGFDSSQNIQIKLHQVPNGVYVIDVEVVNPEEDKTSNDQILAVPWYPVFMYTLALAIEERGEDGGTNSSAVFQRYQSALSDAIAYEQVHKYTGTNFEGDWYVP